MEKRLLILTSNMGHGHLMAAESLAAAAADQKIATRLVDPFRELAGFWHEVTRRAHLTYMEYTPGLWARLYRHFNDEKRLAFLELLQTKNLRRKLRELLFVNGESEWDWIVSTHPMWDNLLRKILREGKKKTPLVAVVTDSISIHRFWQTGDPDYYLVANDDSVQVLRDRGIPADKIKNFGFPVAPTFATYVSRPDFWFEYGLADGKKTLLFIFASAPPLHAADRLTRLSFSSSARDFQALVVTGHNTALRRRLAARHYGFPCRVIGWTRKMPELICQSDIVITKAGGATTMECIAARKPMIITHVLPGQEEGNAELIARYKLGVLPQPTMSWEEGLQEILLGQVGRPEFFANLSRPQAAAEIIAFLGDLLREGE